jgi:hypothetical protein
MKITQMTVEGARGEARLCRVDGNSGVYVLTGHGAKHRGELSNDDVGVPGIGAVKWILAQPAEDATPLYWSTDFRALHLAT